MDTPHLSEGHNPGRSANDDVCRSHIGNTSQLHHGAPAVRGVVGDEVAVSTNHAKVVLGTTSVGQRGRRTKCREIDRRCKVFDVVPGDGSQLEPEVFGKLQPIGTRNEVRNRVDGREVGRAVVESQVDEVERVSVEIETTVQRVCTGTSRDEVGTLPAKDVVATVTLCYHFAFHL